MFIAQASARRSGFIMVEATSRIYQGLNTIVVRAKVRALLVRVDTGSTRTEVGPEDKAQARRHGIGMSAWCTATALVI